MATITAPTDPRPQFSLAAIAVASHCFGGRPSAEVQQIGPDRWWPQGLGSEVFRNVHRRRLIPPCRAGQIKAR